MSDATFDEQMQECADRLARLIAEVFETASARDVEPYALRLASGELALAPLLVAQANLLAAMAMRKADEEKRADG